MTSLQEALARVNVAKQRFAGRHRKMLEVKAIREGRWEEVAPGFFPEEIPEPMVANFIDVAANATAEMIAPLPSFTCANPNMATDAARKSADKRTKIANHYVDHSNLGEQNILAADHLDSYGFTVYSVEPDFDQKTPCIYVESAIGSLYQNDRLGRTVWYARCFRRNVDELAFEYPEFLEDWQILRDKRVGTVEVIRYSDAQGDLLFVPEVEKTLHYLKNPLKRCRFRVVERPKTGDAVRGSYDDAIWVQLARARFGNLAMKIADDVANAPTAVPDDVQDFEVGPNAVIRTQNPQSVRKVDLSVPNQPFAELQNLQNELRLGARYSELRDGNLDASIITGKGVQALMAGSDNHIKTLQGRIAAGLKDVIALCFEMDEALWGNVEKSVTGLSDGAPYEMKYKPSRDISGNYSCSVSYGLTAGLDPNRALVFLLQLQTSGDVSRDTVMRQIPFDLDVVAEQKKIYVEQHRDALMQSVTALAQAIPAMAMQGGDPTEIVGKLSSVIQALQKGDAIEDAVSKAFPAAPPPPQTPASPEEAAAGGAAPGQQAGPPGPEGAGAPGGAPLGGAPQGAGQDLLMGLAGLTGAGNPNLQMNVSTRRPI